MNQEEMIRLALIGQAKEAGVEVMVEKHLEDFRRTYNGCKAVGDNAQGAFVIAFTLFSLEIQKDGE